MNVQKSYVKNKLNSARQLNPLIQLFVVPVIALVMADVMSLVLSISSARLVRWYFLDFPDMSLLVEWQNDLFIDRLWQFGVASLFMMSLLSYAGLYFGRRIILTALPTIFGIIILTALLDAAFSFATRQPYPRLWVVLSWGFLLVLLPFMRVVAIRLLNKAGCWQLPSIIIGSPKSSFALWRNLRRNPLQGYLPEKIVIASEPRRSLLPDGLAPAQHLSVCKSKLELEKFLKGYGRHWRIFLAFDDENERNIYEMATHIMNMGRRVTIVRSYGQLPVYHADVQPLFGEDIVLMRLRNHLATPTAQILKRLLDIILASVLIILATPFFILAAAWIYLADGGPIIYRQKRLGKNGDSFVCLKFRTMSRDAHKELVRWKHNNPERWQHYVKSNFKLPVDPRLLKGARTLRKYSIDELPQLFNVLNGDMSIVGPRPILMREKSEYGHEALQLYQQVRPGLTGLWQIRGRSKTTFARRIELDSWYIRNWNLLIDLLLIIRTIEIVLRGKGERS